MRSMIIASLIESAIGGFFILACGWAGWVLGGSI
jgi:hypothetical protein